MLVFLCAFTVAALLTLAVVRSERAQAHGSGQCMAGGPQDFHATPVPRVGGIGIFGTLVAVSAAWWFYDPQNARIALALAACGIPAFAAGLLEDLTGRVRPALRLLATALSALPAGYVLDATITRSDLWGLGWLTATHPFVAVALAMFVVSGVANAINIIDGFNGLASMCVAMMLLAVAYVARQVGDDPLATQALLLCGAVLGFFVWNYPAGLIFLGDGGAYFLGFCVAELGILLIQRNPAVSPLFPLLLCMYPIAETVFSIYRKRVLRGISPGRPDGVHLHMLVYRRLIRWGFGARTAKELTRRNSMTSPYLWFLCMLAVVPSLLFWNNTLVLAVYILLYGVFYVALYWRIVRFRVPDWLVLRR